MWIRHARRSMGDGSLRSCESRDGESVLCLSGREPNLQVQEGPVGALFPDIACGWCVNVLMRYLDDDDDLYWYTIL